jgi:hypothetical protein
MQVNFLRFFRPLDSSWQKVVQLSYPPLVPTQRDPLSQTALLPANSRSRSMTTLTDEIARRRTFAIVSHPDAGKTTLTEKLLLFGGAIKLAGEVKTRGERRRVRSDWMAVERERGISVFSAVMSFEHEGLPSSYWTRRGTKISARTPPAP